MSIPEVFAHEGEAGFRRREHRELVELLACSEDLVVAGGGGLVTHPPSRDALSGACCVWLRADPGDLVARVGPGGGDRPLLAADPRSRLEELAAERAPLYGEVADLVVDTSGRRPGEVVDAIVEAW